MVKINKIYTRTGDSGTTHLVGGVEVRKDSDRVAAYGDVDELNTAVGLARTLAEKTSSPLVERLSLLQNQLFDLGSELATPPDAKYDGMVQIVADDTTRLERWIDELVEGLPELRSFVLPGGTELNAALHQCRAVCRRAERTSLTLAESETVTAELLIYLNRLSDLFFAMARSESHHSGTPEYLWKPGEKGDEEG